MIYILFGNTSFAPLFSCGVSGEVLSCCSVACCWKYAGGPYITMILLSGAEISFCILHPPNNAINAPNIKFILFLISSLFTSRLSPFTSNLSPFTYFPIQNLPKILFKTSCEVICPVISPRAARQSCRSILRNSPLICICNPSCTRWIASCARTNAS